MRRGAGESGLHNEIGALFKEQNHNFAERFNDRQWIAKLLFSAEFYMFKPPKHLYAKKR